MSAEQSAQGYSYSPADRDAVYRAIGERRDMRHFTSDPVAPEVLQRLLVAAHQAPSVGYMQPWRFIRVIDAGLRQRIHATVDDERRRTGEALGERHEEFMRLKVEGIRECGELLVVCHPGTRAVRVRPAHHAGDGSGLSIVRDPEHLVGGPC